MRGFYRRPTLVLSVALLLVRCGGCGDGEQSPPPGLFADPDVCSAPCDVVLDSGWIATSGSSLTFTWDVGSGPFEGEDRLHHRFEIDGIYTVSVMVSDGTTTTTESVTVTVGALPAATADIDETGGSVTLGGSTVTVPEGVVPQAVAFSLTELPSMQAAADRTQLEGRFTGLGAAYQLSTPVKTSTAFDFAVRDAAAVGKDPTRLAWLVRLIARPVLGHEDPPATSRAPFVDYVLEPVTSVDADGLVHGRAYGRRRFQLVELRAPLNVETMDVQALRPAAVPPAPFVIVVFSQPTVVDQKTFAAAVRDGVTRSMAVYGSQMKYVVPQGTITVTVDGLPSDYWLGAVERNDHRHIRLHPKLESADRIKKIVAHEFFHLVQNLNGNETSNMGFWNEDCWFSEGTADWGMDEVFDAIPDLYHATPWKRFESRLDEYGCDKAREYQTVGFWKWAEAHRPEVIRQIIEHKFLRTHTTPAGGGAMIENDVAAAYLTSFNAMWPDADFLSFVFDARYEKDFDVQETATSPYAELWGPSPQLGPPKQVYTDASKEHWVAAQVSGDSETNPARMPFSLKPHLTADVLVVRSLDITGELHVRLPKVSAAGIDAHVIVYDASSGDLSSEQIVRDLSATHPDVLAAFDPDQAAAVLLADDRFESSTGGAPTTGEVLAWVASPCGPLPSDAIELGPEDDLYVALTSAPSGAVLHLAPGTYSAPMRSWSTPDGEILGNALLKDLTLAGSGEDATTIVMTGDPAQSIGIMTWGNATIRDLTIQAGRFSPIIATMDAKHLVLCSATLRGGSQTTYGILWAPWSGGEVSLRLSKSALLGGATPNDGWGIFVQSCYEPPAQVTVQINDSQIRGWDEGLAYYTGEGECGTVTVDTDCEGFSQNNANVVRWDCSPGICTPNELCP